MGKGKPRALKSKDVRPCRRCQAPILMDMYEVSDRLCPRCWQAEWHEHQDYIQQNAIVVAELGVGFTTDLFSSELVIEADGGYFQTVRWHAPQDSKTLRDEHLSSFELGEWSAILAETEALHQSYIRPDAIIDDVETYGIAVRIDEQLHWMQRQGKWQLSDGDRRFRILWNCIHQQSPWFSRLSLMV